MPDTRVLILILFWLLMDFKHDRLDCSGRGEIFTQLALSFKDILIRIYELINFATHTHTLTRGLSIIRKIE